MKKYERKNAGFNLRIIGILFVTMLATTLLWAKPKKVEYSPFKSEKPNATVFECEYIKGYDEGLVIKHLLIKEDRDRGYETEIPAITVYGWKKKKGGWEKLDEYKISEYERNKIVLDDDSDDYTHYAVEYEDPENSLIFSAQGQRVRNYNGFEDNCMVINISISEDYKKRIDEKRAAEEAEKERLAAIAAEEEARKKAQKKAELDAKAKAIARGYVYHGIDENERNRKFFSGGALEAGHAYYISGFVVKYGGTMAAIEYGDGLFFSSRSSAVYVDYIDQKVKGEILDAGIKTLLGTTIEFPLAVVVVGGKTSLHTPVVIGLVE